jgi:saccharopine dehydrogenase-like NADP-dependent oxidoreductase
MLFAHEEVISLPRFIGKGLKYVDIKMHCDPVQKAIYQLGLVDTKPIQVKGVKVVPRDVLLKLVPKTPSMEELAEMYKTGILGNDVFIFTVDVRGEKAGEKINHIIHVKSPSLSQIQKKTPGANCVSYSTGTSAAIFTEMLGKKEIRNRGAFPPECLEPKARETFIAKLSEKDLEVYERVERLLT